MKRPKQLPAVDRNARKTAAVPAGANVSPSASFWNEYLAGLPMTTVPVYQSYL